MTGMPNQGYLAQALQNYAPAFGQSQQLGASLAGTPVAGTPPPSLQQILSQLAAANLGAGGGMRGGMGGGQPAVLPNAFAGLAGSQQPGGPAGSNGNGLVQLLQQLKGLMGNSGGNTAAIMPGGAASPNSMGQTNVGNNWY
jgi:hypothetical protein